MIVPSPDRHIPLATWIWRSYAKTALVPLLLVEVALIATYIQTNYWSRQANIETLSRQATEEMQRIAEHEAAIVSRQLNAVTQLTELYRRQTALALADPKPAIRENPDRYRLTDQGTYYAVKDDGGSAVFYSGAAPVREAEKQKVRLTAALDPLMKDIKSVNPLVVQLYLNTHDSLNRIYPFMDVLSQYPPKMDIPTYNFYYEADARHNPARVPVWTDVYLDPAGQGWMTSCIAPVYRGDFLEGVVGLDVTVDTMIRRILDLRLPWNAYAVLVGKNGSLLAMPPSGERDFGLNELDEHRYDSAVTQDTFKPEEFNLFKRPKLSALAQRLGAETSGAIETDIGEKRLVSWRRVEETGWTFMIVAAPENIFESAIRLSQRLEIIGYWMIVALVLFYCLFFMGLLVRARKASRAVAAPLEQIDGMMRRIGQGEYDQPLPSFEVRELHETARNLRAMGHELGTAHSHLLDAQQNLREHVRWLNAVFQLSPDGLVTFDSQGRMGQGNPAFFAMTGFDPRRASDWTANEFWQEIRCLAETPQDFLELAQDAAGDFRMDFVRPRPRNVYCNIRRFEDERSASGEGRSLIVYFRDITQETEIDRMKSEFLATAAHELRTPLTSILGYAELLAENEFDAETQRELLTAILIYSRNLDGIVGDLIDLARIESRAGRDFHIVPQTLATAVEDAIAASGLEERGRRPIYLPPAENDPARRLEVAVDAEKIKQALLNVLNNAENFSASDTPIEIGWRSRLAGEELELGVEVADRGIGMTEEQVRRIFERFFRGDLSGKNPGTGLGMSIVKEIMDIHRGVVEIDSQPGQGSRIGLWFKAAGRPIPDADAGESRPAP